MDEKTFKIPYKRGDGFQSTACIIPVKFSLKGLTNEDIQVLGHLSNAVNNIAPIYANQISEHSIEILSALLDLEKTTNDKKDREILKNYIDLYNVMSAPFDAKNHNYLLELEENAVSQNPKINQFKEFLFSSFQAPAGKNLYPKDITKEELAYLSKENKIHNSTITRDENKKLIININEEQFKENLVPIISSIEKAYKITTSPELKDYLLAKIKELKTGSKEAIWQSDLAWINNSSKIDFVLGTAVEEYADELLGIRGIAQGAVYTINEEYESICNTLLNLLPELELAAPWSHKKASFANTSTKLRYVDVLTWSGFYDCFPKVTLAESLPNDQAFKEKHGTVNVIFVNVQEARFSSPAENARREEFFLKSDIEKYNPLIPKMHIILTALHELGHQAGAIFTEDPRHVFKEEYSLLEEARAEVFSIWALPTLLNKNIISAEEEIAGFYAMLSSILMSIQSSPKDHDGARNLMFNYFLENQAVSELTEDEKTIKGSRPCIKYSINPEKFRQASISLLKILGDIRAIGDVKSWLEFRHEFISAKRQKEFEDRLKSIPFGLGLIFPTLKYDNTLNQFTSELIYPNEIREQPRTVENLTKKHASLEPEKN